MKYELHNVDCMEFMKSLPDKYFDLCLTDPPYGIGIANNSFRQKHEKKEWDNKPATKEQINNLIRVSNNQVIWGGNYFDLPPTRCFLIWDKVQPEDFSSAMVEMAWASFESPAKSFKRHVVSYEKFHPTTKPVELMVWCIDKYSKMGDTIFDPFMGSGTTGVACAQLGRNFVGCEIDKDYFKIAEKRIKQAYMQEPLL